MPIEMIAWTEKNGTIHPLKFKFCLNNGDKQICPIVKSYTLKQNLRKNNGIIHYTCEAIINKQIKLCTLSYETTTCLWKISDL